MARYFATALLLCIVYAASSASVKFAPSIKNGGWSGHFCDYNVTQLESYTTYRQVSYAEKYSTRDCGIVGLWKCTRYRIKYRQETYTSWRQIYETLQHCCEGWYPDHTGVNCTIHDQPPMVEFCPDTIVHQAEGDTAIVTWPVPVFKEPHGWPLDISSPYDKPTQELPWGATTITYTAISENNNMESQCVFQIYVKPPADHPVIVGYEDGDMISENENIGAHFVCRADYGLPPFYLEWAIDLETIEEDVSYYTEPHELVGYQNAIGELTLTLDRSHDGKVLTCRGIKGGQMIETVSLYLNITYDPTPVIEYCPRGIGLTTAERYSAVPLEEPRFSDINSDPLLVRCNIPENHQFVHGDHLVVYTAENLVTGQKTNCSYYVIVDSFPCEPLEAPMGGASVCGTWYDPRQQFCVVMCNEDKDVHWTSIIPDVYSCSFDGNWHPRSKATCSVSRSKTTNNLASSRHYFPGPCNEDSQLMRDSFKEVLAKSAYGAACKPECEPLSLEVHCP